MERPENLDAQFGWKTKTTAYSEKLVIPSSNPGTGGFGVFFCLFPAFCFFVTTSAFPKPEGIALQEDTQVPHSCGLRSPDPAVPKLTPQPLSKARRGIKKTLPP